MKIVLDRALQNSHGRFAKGDQVDWPPNDCAPLLELKYAHVPASAVQFSSAKAEELAGGMELEPGGGSGKNGKYTVADVRKMEVV